MRVSIRGEGLPSATMPMWVSMDLSVLPRRGDYIDLGDRMRRYVSAVVFDCTPSKWDGDRQLWVPEHPRSQPWTVIIETRLGIAS